MPDEKATMFKGPYLYGRHARRCGGHKREGQCTFTQRRGEIDVRASNVTPGEEPDIMKNSIFVKGPESSGG